MIQISDRAAAHIKTLRAAEDVAPEGLRIFVSGGGCSGFKYGFTWEDGAPEADDVVIEKDGIKVFVDSMSSMYLEESVVDFEVSLAGSAFTINNPNVTSTCGCGSSFAV